ncbi:hypothetical protein SPLA10_PHROGS00025 [Salmonella phage SPLA10]|nr:hypothetical protein SPLA10_PHROGS00025 [Salmonella phage SPLA10]
MTKQAILPITGQSDPMFTLIDPNGNDLHKHLMELNRLHADEEVRKNTGEVLVSELERIRDNLEQTQGVTRRDMEEVETVSGVTLESMPIAMFTERRSSTGLTVALEEIDVRKAGIIAAGIVAALGLLLKMISWFGKKASGGAGGGGGGAKVSTVAEKMKSVEDEVESKSDESAKTDLSSDDKKTAQDMLTAYLDKRSLLQDNCLKDNSYVDAFVKIIPSFEAHLETSGIAIDRTTTMLEMALAGTEETPANANRIQSLINETEGDHAHFNKWPEALVLIKALGVQPRGDASLGDMLKAVMDKLQEENDKPTKLRVADLGPTNTYKGLDNEFKRCLRTLGTIEETGSKDSEDFFLSTDTLAKAVDTSDNSQKKLQEMLTKLQSKNGALTTNSMQINNFVGKAIKMTIEQARVINMIMALSEIIGGKATSVCESTTALTEKLLKISFA